MGYTLSTIRQRILEDKLDDEGYPASVVDRFINDAQRDIFNTYELPFTEATFEGNMAAGGTVYNMPNDVQVIQTLKIVSPDKDINDISRNYLSFREFNSRFPVPGNNEPSAPMHWTSHSGKVYFSAPTSEDFTMKIFYNKKPAELQDETDVPSIPEEFGEVLVLGAYIRCLERNEDFDLAAYYRDGEYARMTDQMLFRLSKRQTGGPMVMSQPQRAAPIRSRRNP